MSSRDVAELICFGSLPVAGLAVWLVYLLSRRLERGDRGRRNQGAPAGAGLLFELDKLARPSIENVIKAQDETVERDAHGGQ